MVYPRRASFLLDIERRRVYIAECDLLVGIPAKLNAQSERKPNGIPG